MDNIYAIDEDNGIGKDLDTISKTLVGLEELYLAVADTLQDGGLSYQNSVMLHLVVKQTCGNTPINVPKIPGIESYDGIGNRMHETLLGLESVGEMIKQAIDWFLALVAKFKKTIIEIWSRWFSSAKDLIVQIKKLQDLVDKVTNDTGPKESVTVSDTVWCNLLIGKDFSSKVIPNEVLELGNTITASGGYEGVAKILGSYLPHINKILDPSIHTDEGSSFYGDANLSVENVAKNINEHGIKIEKDAKRENCWVSTKEFIGNKQVLYKFKTANNYLDYDTHTKVFKSFVSVSISLESTLHTPVPTMDEHSVAALSKKEIIQLLDVLDNLAVSIKNCKGNSTARATSLKSVENLVKKANTTLTDEFSEKYPRRYYAATAFINHAPNLPKAIYNPSNDLCHLGILVIKSGLSYANASYKNLCNNSKSAPPPPSKHRLLLIVPAKRLSNELNETDDISVEGAKKLITNAVEAYCYSENDSDGNKVQSGVKYSNTDSIDYATDVMVYVHLKLFAQPSIIEKPISRLSLREKIASHPITVEQFGKLQSPDSTSDFYEI